MESSKIKNIVLLILLIVNLFLLVQVADQERKSAQYVAETRAGAVEVLARQDLAVRMEKLPDERTLPSMTIAARDRAGEEAMAEHLLGGSPSASEQGGPAAYQGEKGEGLFFSNGRFSFTFNEAAWPLNGEEPEKHAARLMAAAGFVGVGVESGPGQEEGTYGVTLRQVWEGEEIFDCIVKLTYQSGALRTIEGQRLTGTPQAGRGENGLSVATVLVRFLSGVREAGQLCNEIRDLRLGYELTVEAGGNGTLTPVWLVVTDAKSFYVDGLDGTLRLAD